MLVPMLNPNGCYGFLTRPQRSTILRVKNCGVDAMMFMQDTLKNGNWVSSWSQKGSGEVYRFGYAAEIPGKTEVMAVLTGRGFPRWVSNY